MQGNKNLAFILLGGVLLGCLGFWLGGCQRVPGAPGQTASKTDEDENAKLREILERTGQTMEQLIAQVELQQTREAQKLGDPPVVRDLAVARAALAEAQKAATASAKDTNATAAALSRLRRVLQSIAAELPAALISQYVDRALYRLHAALSVGSSQFAEALQELVAAYDVAHSGRPAELVPAVANELDNAIKALKKKDPSGTVQILNEVLAKTTEHAAVKALAQAQLEAFYAQQALQRGAWAVVAAELAELENVLSEIVAAPPASEKTSAAPAENAAPAEASSSASTPASSQALPPSPAQPGLPSQPVPGASDAKGAAPSVGSPAPATGPPPSAPAPPANAGVATGH